MKSIHFKLPTESNLSLLHSWFQKPHIKQWDARDENYIFDMIREKYLPRILHPESIPNFIIYADNTPIGYIKLYCIEAYLTPNLMKIAH